MSRLTSADHGDDAAKLDWLGQLRGWAARHVAVLAIVAAAAVAAYLGYLFLSRSSDKPFSNLEQTFFGAYTLFLGAAISWLTTHVYAKKETAERFQQLARPALRRVLAASDSTEGLLKAIEARQELADGATAREALRSLRELVEQHGRSLQDAIADWRELLPEDVATASRELRERAQLREAIEPIVERLDELEGNKANGPEIAELTREVLALRSEFARRSDGGSFALRVSEDLRPNRGPVRRLPLSLRAQLDSGSMKEEDLSAQQRALWHQELVRRGDRPARNTELRPPSSDD